MTAPVDTPSTWAPTSSHLYTTREEWLVDAAHLLWDHIMANADPEHWTGDHIAPVRVSVGFPGGTRHGKTALAECWPPRAVADGVSAIFINPTQSESEPVLHSLLHELCHVKAGPEHGHRRGSEFDRVARAVGLEGPLTATHPGEGAKLLFGIVLTVIGAYERVHSPLLIKEGHKPEGTRLKKVFCRRCGFVARITRKHMNIKAEFDPYFTHTCPPGTPEPPSGGGGGGGGDKDEYDVTPPPKGGEGEGGDGGDSGDGGDDTRGAVGGYGADGTADGTDGDSGRAGDGSDDDSDSGGAGDGSDDDSGGDESEEEVIRCHECGAEYDPEKEGGVGEDGKDDLCAPCLADERLAVLRDDARFEATKARGFGLPSAKLPSAKATHSSDFCPFVTGCPQCEV